MPFHISWYQLCNLYLLGALSEPCIYSRDDDDSTKLTSLTTSLLALLLTIV